jgi:hypothetical protein
MGHGARIHRASFEVLRCVPTAWDCWSSENANWIEAACFTRHRVYDWKMPQLQKITATGGRARCAFVLFSLGPSLQDGCLMRKLWVSADVPDIPWFEQQSGCLSAIVRRRIVPDKNPTEDLCLRGQPSGFSVATLRWSLLFATLSQDVGCCKW